ncbi:aminopeptidase P family protein [Balneatrix alpica]|uniref:aminopeptidase P family protein n=1 Tax=Balneatrix alpica TaxID=75684 RepID=UPI0027398188|nr:aminopeptidase P family protein [Balneatrix alpica]
MPNPAARLAALRTWMQQQGLDAWYQPSADPHDGEYVPAHWQGRAWLSGFDGSAGTLVVTAQQAGLWTDGRYYIQAEQQLQGSGIQLFRQVDPGVPSPSEWLATTLAAGATLGFEPDCLSLAQARQFTQAGLTLAPQANGLDAIWSERPPLPMAPAYLHQQGEEAEPARHRLQRLYQAVQAQGADHHIIASLDDIGWALNLRGQDVPYHPLALAYLLLTPTHTVLFIDLTKLNHRLQQHLQAAGVQVLAYQQVYTELAQLPAEARILLDPQRIHMGLVTALPSSVHWVEGAQPSTALKAIKHPRELAHWQQAMRYDGIAMVRLMRWLEQAIPQGEATELSVEEELQRLRASQPGYHLDSFRTIAGFGPHGAMMHYGATPASNQRIQAESFFLLDSGGQYEQGTTDITRTFNFGPLSQQQRLDYTLTLQGLIRLSKAHFKAGTRGTQLDVLARAALWQQGIDYACGTGHGVGFFMNVHEGPHSLSQRWIDVALQPGMVVTIEPGVYRSGEYGIRIENLMQVVPAERTEFGQFYRFEPLTLAPINLAPLLPGYLSVDELAWLNAYHQRVYAELSPYLQAEEQAWLAQACQPWSNE